jgi:hemolysin-activating ACP:hemolysin acyltransferase
MQAKLGEIRSKLSTAFSQVTLAMMTTPRYRHMAIADLEWLVLEPLLRDRIAIAHSRKEADDQSGIVGFAIWAKVSDEVSGKIEEQAKAGTFPVRLRGGEWASGETIWLLDVVAANRQLATAVLVNFGQLAKGAPVRIHPAIRRWVEPEVLARLAKSGIK